MKTASRHALRQGTRGFSLVEVLIAVTIIVLMGGVVAYNVFPELFRSQRDRARMDIETLKTAVNMYFTRENRLPNDSEWPDFLINGSKNHPDPYIDKDKVKDGKVVDPWGNEYTYRKLSSKDFEIVSYGMDGTQGGEGDDKDISSKGE
jgi:general secretion pathway protein G